MVNAAAAASVAAAAVAAVERIKNFDLFAMDLFFGGTRRKSGTVWEW